MPLRYRRHELPSKAPARCTQRAHVAGRHGCAGDSGRCRPTSRSGTGRWRSAGTPRPPGSACSRGRRCRGSRRWPSGRTHASSVIWPVIDSAVDVGTSTPSWAPSKVSAVRARTPAATPAAVEVERRARRVGEPLARRRRSRATPPDRVRAHPCADRASAATRREPAARDGAGRGGRGVGGVVVGDLEERRAGAASSPRPGRSATLVALRATSFGHGAAPSRRRSTSAPAARGRGSPAVSAS